MINFKKILLFLLVFLSLLFLGYPGIRAETAEEKLQRLTSEIEQYEQEIERLKNQATTLSNQIAQYDAQIKLTSLKISQTEEKILLLGGRIEQLEVSLQSLSDAFSSRVVRTYKMSRVSQPYLLLMSPSELNDKWSSFHYLKMIQESDRDLLIRLENAQMTYEEEKVEQEELQVELERQKAVLDTQKAAKANLLAQTKSNERKFQSLLASARSEFEAIQAIIAGRGEEEEVGRVNEGQKIASIISGASCNSSGDHLHFVVSDSGNVQNPFNFLGGGVDFENCSGSSCGSGDADPFNPSGSWNWPIVPKIKLTQGYGVTWSVNNTWVSNIYSFHNGIDINSYSSRDVKAVKAGVLYRGSYTGSGGCRLRYVRVDHDDSNIDTFYLHVNY